MDLRLLDAPPTDAEREAIDAVVGEASGTERPGRARRPDETPPPPPRPPRRAAARRLGQRGRARLRVAPALGAARGCVRRRELLRAARARGAPGRPDARLHRPVVRAQGRAGRARASTRARASASASARPPRYRTIAGAEPRELQLPETAPPLPQAGDPSLRLLRRIGAGVDPTSLDAYVAAGGFEQLAARARARRGRRDRRAEGVAAARPRRRRVPDRRQVGGGAPASRRSRTTSSATPTSRSPGRSRTAC